MLHMTKLCVGITDINHLARVQAHRLEHEPPLRHTTRSFPRRVAEIIDGGSLYWVIAGAMCVRQRILDIIPDTWDDGTACAGIVLDPTLTPVLARPTRPFQGWRYLDPSAAPPDLARTAAGDGEAQLPAALAAELRALCLI
jgi:hypothetical protein